jgi:hypothetical protein
MTEHVFLPQYAAHAVHDFETLYRRAKARRGELSSNTWRYIELCNEFAALLREGTHIVLPPNAEIYRPNTTKAAMPTKEECESLVGAPAPITCLEYPWTHKPDVGLFAPKRITITIDGKQIAEKEDPSRVYAMNFYSIIFDENTERWQLAPIALALAQPFEMQPSRNDQNWGFKGCIRDLYTGDDLWPGSVFEDQIVDQKMHKRMIAEFYPDVIAATQCFHSLRAGAEMEERREPSPTRRRKFEKKGVGGFTYHVLKIPRVGIVSSHTSYGGTHASPRFHVRRAHIRKLSSGALTFVRQHFVGDADRGKVDKHYQLEGNDGKEEA